jgi:hypothetical protein
MPKTEGERVWCNDCLSRHGEIWCKHIKIREDYSTAILQDLVRCDIANKDNACVHFELPPPPPPPQPKRSLWDRVRGRRILPEDGRLSLSTAETGQLSLTESPKQLLLTE